MGWADLGTAVAALIKEILRVAAPEADEKEKRLKIRAKEAFKRFLERTSKEDSEDS